MRSSDGTTPSALGAGPLGIARGRAPLVFLPCPSFSQITSTGLVDVEEIELETQSREKTEEEEEEAEEEIEEA